MGDLGRHNKLVFLVVGFLMLMLCTSLASAAPIDCMSAGCGDPYCGASNTDYYDPICKDDDPYPYCDYVLSTCPQNYVCNQDAASAADICVLDCSECQPGCDGKTCTEGICRGENCCGSSNTYSGCSECDGTGECAKCCKCDTYIIPPCFLAGTKISMFGGGYKEIEDVKVGDFVESYDSALKAYTFNKVVELFIHQPEEMITDYYLIINDAIKVTAEHPFFTSKGRVLAKHLSVGDELINNEGSFTLIKSIEQVEERVVTYNFEVENTHTYFAEGVAVHNRKEDDEDDMPVVAVIFVDNLITGNSVSCSEGYIKKACSEIPSSDCDVCGCGSAICDNDGVCETGENVNNCCDCKPCYDACKYKDADGNIYTGAEGQALDYDASKIACEGSQTGDCRWCPKPYSSSPHVSIRHNWNPKEIPFIVPGDAHYELSDGCFNIKNGDPFNCGGCGFARDSSTSLLSPVLNNNCMSTEPLKSPGFPNAPYCDASTDTCSASSANAGTWFQDITTEPYKSYLAQPNPLYFYSKSEDPNKAASNDYPSYTIRYVDTEEEICSWTGGTLDEDYGCCGNGKVRADAGKMCNLKVMCDGYNWHDAQDPDTEGEIFKIDFSKSGVPYPFVSIEGKYTLCIDYQHYEQKFIKSRQPDPNADFLEGCMDDSISEEVRALGYTPNDGQDSFKPDFNHYLCPTNYFMTGRNHILAPEGQPCRDDHVSDISEPYDRSGGAWMFCTAEEGLNQANLKGWAYMLDIPKSQLAYDSSLPFKYTSFRCNAAAGEWVGGGSSNKIVVNMACPGMTFIDEENLPSKSEVYVAPYGASPNQHYTAGLCLRLIPGEDIYEDAPKTSSFMMAGFEKGDGLSVMGSVKNHSYICNTEWEQSGPIDYQVKVDEYDHSHAYVGICCGEKGCGDIPGKNNIQGGSARMFGYGDSMQTASGPIYCLKDGSWSLDLDNTSKQDVCNQAGFKGTGKYCCSEGEDSHIAVKEGKPVYTAAYFAFNGGESYNDPGSTVGACFKSSFQYNNRPLSYNSTTYNNIFVYNGTFLGCGFDLEADFATEVDNKNLRCFDNATKGRPSNISRECLQSIEDWPNSKSWNSSLPADGTTNEAVTRTYNPLIKKVDYCQILNSSTRKMCDVTGNWVSIGQRAVFNKSVVPTYLLNYMKGIKLSELSDVKCCPEGQCWNPMANICENTYSPDRFIYVNSTYYQCVFGEWVNMSADKSHYSADGCMFGFCNSSSMCLDPELGCVESSTIAGKNICSNGVWVSRAGVLAAKLAKSAPSNFTINCGMRADDLFNNKQNPGEAVGSCVMEYSEGGKFKRVVGFVIEGPYYSNITLPGFSAALGQSFFVSYGDIGAFLHGDEEYDFSNFNFGSDCFNKSLKNKQGGYVECYSGPTTDAGSRYHRVWASANDSMIVIGDESYDGNSLNPNTSGGLCTANWGWLSWLKKMLCPPARTYFDPASEGVFDKLVIMDSDGKRMRGVKKEGCGINAFGNNDPAPETPDIVYLFNYSQGFSQEIAVDLKMMLINEGVDAAANKTLLAVRNPRISSFDLWTVLNFAKN